MNVEFAITISNASYASSLILNQTRRIIQSTNYEVSLIWSTSLTHILHSRQFWGKMYFYGTQVCTSYYNAACDGNIKKQLQTSTQFSNNYGTGTGNKPVGE